MFICTETLSSFFSHVLYCFSCFEQQSTIFLQRQLELMEVLDEKQMFDDDVIQ